MKKWHVQRRCFHRTFRRKVPALLLSIELGVPVVEFFADVRGEGCDDAVVEAVDPAVDGDFLAALPSVFDDGGACDMAGLGEHIEFAEAVGGSLGW